MASLSTPTLTITQVSDQSSLVTVAYQIQFNTFDRATDQPYDEIVALIGDDTNVPGDPPSAAPDDKLMTIASGDIVRASRTAGKPALERNVLRTIFTDELNEDFDLFDDPDEIRALVTLTPRPPIAVSQESNLVTLSVRKPPPDTTTVPEVLGLALVGPDGGATKLVADSDLVAKIVPPNPNPPPRNATVFKQDPQSGTVVARRSTVTLTWRAGRP